MNKTTEQLNADALFAFQMALKGHREFEYQHQSGLWYRTDNVSTRCPHRIYHDIPEGWALHDGEDWKWDKDAVLEEIMTHDGMVSPNKNQTAAWWGGLHGNNFTAENHSARIYAYKLAAKSPAIPEAFTAHDGGKLPIDGDLRVEAIRILGSKYMGLANHLSWTDIIAYRVIEKKVIPWDFADAPINSKVKRKSDGKIFRMSAYPDEAGLYPTSYGSDGERVTYETLAADYLQLDGSVCGKEVE